MVRPFKGAQELGVAVFPAIRVAGQIPERFGARPEKRGYLVWHARRGGSGNGLVPFDPPCRRRTWQNDNAGADTAQDAHVHSSFPKKGQEKIRRPLIRILAAGKAMSNASSTVEYLPGETGQSISK